jgi:2-polyprenyl-3-methyl-5-hydroxy-6-metoxy-1,4-benzoquinol methylase
MNLKSIEFIKLKDELSKIINEKCNEIFHLIANTDVEALDIDPFYKWYFKKCHFERPFFSLKTSAKLLYDAIKVSGKPYYEVSLIDYGAGVGSLYVLAKMIGCKQVFYNDYDAKFAQMAMEIDTIFGVKMDDYIVGDSDITFKQMREKGYELDIVMSRNVIEHIYDLENYYHDISSNYPNAIIVSSTTANWNNPLAHMQHVYMHLKNKKAIMKAKVDYIKDVYKIEDQHFLDYIFKNWQTAGGQEIDLAIKEFQNNGTIKVFAPNYTNICNEYGVWSENLLPYQTHKRFAKDYELDIKPGIWDEDYSCSIINLFTKKINLLILKSDKFGCFLSSYIIFFSKPK